MPATIVQAVAKNALSNTISATTAGNALIVCIDSFGSAAPSISSVKLGTASLSLAKAQTIAVEGDTSSYIYYLGNIAGGQTSVVVTGSNLVVDTSDGGVDILEVSGLLAASLLDKTNSGSGTGTSWSSGASGTLTQADELVVGTATGFNMTSPSGWTMVSGGGTARRTGYKIVSATTTQTFNSTMNTADWTACIASFKAAAVVNSSAAAAVASML